MINGTKNIQSPVPGRVYTPRKIPYKVACTNFNLIMLSRSLGLYPHLYSPNNGCANLTIAPSDPVFINYTAAVITRRANVNSVKVVTPGTYDTINYPESNLGFFTFPLAVVVRVDYQNNKCLIESAGRNDLAHNATGISVTPQTTVAKCVFPLGHVITLSMTSVRYSVPDFKSFRNISASVFQSSIPNPLVSAMQDSITDGTLSNLTVDTLDTKSVMEIRFSGTKVDFLMCSSRRAGIGGNLYLNCIYSIVTTIFSEPQPMLPEIVDLRGANKPIPVPPLSSALITFDHLPVIGANGSSSVFAVRRLLNESASVAQYLAALGQNFFIDWDDGALYTIFDTVDMQKGYEIPAGLFGTVVGIMTFCLIFRIAAEVILDVKYKGSMLWVLTKEMESHLGRPTPTLVKVNSDPLVMEGIPLVAKRELLDLKEEYEEE
ncbi:hypothetical protein BG000_010520 [Podila horticola]|nr:hypothetical protein BG000_010520 [Podila horticola]